MRHISFKLFAEGCEKLSLLPSKQTWEPWEQPWAPTERMPNKPGPGSAGSVENPLHEGNLGVPDLASSNTSSPYASQLIPNIQKYMGGTLDPKRHGLLPKGPKKHTQAHRQSSAPQSSRNPPQSASRLSRNVWQKSTYCVHSPAGLTLPLCHLDFIRFINMCSLPQAHSICPAHVNVSVFLGTFSPLRW